MSAGCGRRAPAEACRQLRSLCSHVQTNHHGHPLARASLQSIVTRWGKDPFALGSYSFTKKLATGNYNGYSNAHKK